jgi:hypothetical protein
VWLCGGKAHVTKVWREALQVRCKACNRENNNYIFFLPSPRLMHRLFYDITSIYAMSTQLLFARINGSMLPTEMSAPVCRQVVVV